MITLSKALTGTLAAGAMAVASVTPAQARDRNDGGISTGDVIAGALVLGGIAVVAAAASNNDNDDRRYGDYRYDRAGYGGRYGDRGYDNGYYGRDNRYGRGNPRAAVERCVRTAEQQAGRYSYGRADVTDVRSVRETRWGYEVKGRIAVNSMGRDWHRGDRDYGRGWNGDYRGWNNSHRGYDSGSFKCRFERGQVVDLDYSGLRGL